MKLKASSELFPLFETAAPQTIERLLSVAVAKEYSQNKTIILEDSWGNAVYLIVSGWVKVRRLQNENSLTFAVLGRGDFFGEMGILDESPRSSDVVSLCNVNLLSISAQNLLQALMQDANLQHKMLQLIVQRMRHFNARFEMRDYPPAIKLVNMLVILADKYGQTDSETKEIFNFSPYDLADLADISVAEVTTIIEKLSKNGWLEIDKSQQKMYLLQYRKLVQLANKN